jgi:hypothetical protein
MAAIGVTPILLEECDYTYTSGLYGRKTAAEMFLNNRMSSFLLGINYVVPVLDQMLANGEVIQEQLDNVTEGECSAAGKMMFADFFAKKGLRDWLGAPPEINDGRLLGAYIELHLQMWLGEYSIVAFNKDEVIYDITLLSPTTPIFPVYALMFIGDSTDPPGA